MKTSEVFGIAPNPRKTSYVDRGQLDEILTRQLERSQHIALRGESKCGKSWLRQTVVPDAIVVQCRLSKTAADIYIDALSQLDITLEVRSESTKSLKGTVTAKGEMGFAILAKASGEASGTLEDSRKSEHKPVGHDINDLRFVAQIIEASGRRLVVEDFHYLKMDERKHFAFDLKALWDYGLFVVVIGVWSQSNMLLHLNPDLSGRVYEISLAWNNTQLAEIIEKGGSALNIKFSDPVTNKLASLGHGNSGIVQTLALLSLDEAKIYEKGFSRKSFDDSNAVDTAAMQYAEQLNPLYQQFAKNVSSGIRTRKNSTGIYAHAMAVILNATDLELLNGLSASEICNRAVKRQSRIQLGNLKTILEKIEELQIDADGRGLILAYNQSTEEVTVVDRQLLLYRKFATVKWPWEELIKEGDQNSAFAADTP